MSKRDEYAMKMQEQLELWTARLDAMTVKATDDEARHAERSKSETHQQLDAWRVKGQSASAKLTELKAATGDSWDTMKLEMDKVWYGIERGLDPVEPLSPTLVPT